MTKYKKIGLRMNDRFIISDREDYNKAIHAMDLSNEHTKKIALKLLECNPVFEVGTPVLSGRYNLDGSKNYDHLLFIHDKDNNFILELGNVYLDKAFKDIKFIRI